jgi:hypothetical protein
MKQQLATLLMLFASSGMTYAFVSPPAFTSATVILQAKGAASSKEEDMELTRKVIAEFMDMEPPGTTPPVATTTTTKEDAPVEPVSASEE